jgi:hypothetical protein
MIVSGTFGAPFGTTVVMVPASSATTLGLRVPGRRTFPNPFQARRKAEGGPAVCRGAETKANSFLCSNQVDPITPKVINQIKL